MTSKAILVLGMHRSGTSALAGVLSMCAAYPGSLLLPAADGVNPKGFWEHSEIVAVHDELLFALDAHWDDERNLPPDWSSADIVEPFRQRLLEIIQRDFSGSDLWLVKDPRLCRLLPLWLDILDEIQVSPRFVLCLRHPQQVAMSLRRRDSIPEARASLLWLQHVLESEIATRNRPRVIVTYDDLLGGWEAVVQDVFTTLSLPFSLAGCEREKIEGFLDPSLRHHATGNDSPAMSAPGHLANKVYREIVSGRWEEISSAYDETRRIADGVAPWVGQIMDMKNYIERRNAEYRDLESEIDRVKKTFSWKITRPLRAISRIADLRISRFLQDR